MPLDLEQIKRDILRELEAENVALIAEVERLRRESETSRAHFQRVNARAFEHRAEIERLQAIGTALVENETTEDDWECVRSSDMDALRAALSPRTPEPCPACNDTGCVDEPDGSRWYPCNCPAGRTPEQEPEQHGKWMEDVTIPIHDVPTQLAGDGLTDDTDAAQAALDAEPLTTTPVPPSTENGPKANIPEQCGCASGYCSWCREDARHQNPPPGFEYEYRAVGGGNLTLPWQPQAWREREARLVRQGEPYLWLERRLVGPPERVEEE